MSMNSLTDKPVFKKTICPVCDHYELDFLTRYYSGEDWENNFAFNDTYLVECRRCGTIFQAPLENRDMSPENFGRAYYKPPKDVELEQYALDHINATQMPHYKAMLDYFLNHVDPRSHHKWLDVGSAGCPTIFEPFDFTTLEPSPEIVAIGKKLYCPDKIVCGTIESFQTVERFDGVVFLSSLYYVPNPAETLDRVFDLLHEKGLLVIAIGQYFMETKSHFGKGLFLRIEDIFRGNIKIYYTINSLKYLCGRHGFRFESVFEQRQDEGDGYRTIRYLMFKKDKSVTVNDEDECRKAREHQQGLLKAAISNFEDVTRDTLQKINRGNTIIIGSADCVTALSRYGDLTEIAGVLDYKNPAISGCMISGLKWLSINDAQDVILQSDEVVNLVVVSWKYQNEAVEFIKNNLHSGITNIWKPSRHSGMEFMDIPFRDGFLTSKGLELIPVKLDAYETEADNALLVRQYVRHKMTAFGSVDFLLEIYRAYIHQFSGKSLIIWGTGSFYHKHHDIFSGITIEMFIDNSPERQGTTIHGIPVNPPSALQDCDLPLVICSLFKHDIYQQVRELYPHIKDIP